MMMISSSWSGRLASRVAVFAAATVVLGCGIEKQSAPALAGPSEYGLSLTLTATPDTIVANGESQSTIQVVTRDPNGQPMPNVTLQFDVFVNQPIEHPSLTQTTAVTDANGQATIGLVAPPAPATQFAIDPVVTVRAIPLGTNFGNATAHSVDLRLIAPVGTPPGSQVPVAVIVANPPVADFNQTIRFDASLSTDEGLACGNRCQYIWQFGDNTEVVRGITVDHAFTLPGTYTVTLTVTDNTGGVDTATVSVQIMGPAAPTASFTVSPSSPRVGTETMFDASNSTVGYGVTIARYNWNFGDGTSDSRDTARAPHFYSTAGTYTVTLTVTDSLGRESAPVTAPITVIP